jgi:hypothetical protein
MILQDGSFRSTTAGIERHFGNAAPYTAAEFALYLSGQLQCLKLGILFENEMKVKNKSSENKVTGWTWVSLPRDIQKAADLWTSILSRKGMRKDLPPVSLGLNWQQRTQGERDEG